MPVSYGNSVHKTVPRGTRAGAPSVISSDSNFARDGGYDLHESSVVAVDDDDDDDVDDDVDDDDNDDDDEIFADFEGSNVKRRKCWRRMTWSGWGAHRRLQSRRPFGNVAYGL